MGTRGEIYVRNSDSVVELWRHFDAYEEHMRPYFEGFARYAAWCVGKQRHWLTYPEDVAAMLIAYDHEVSVAHRLGFPLGTFECCGTAPDLRPRGNIDDFEKVWILDVPSFNQADIVWRVRGFDRIFGSNAKRMRDCIRRMKDNELAAYLKRVCDFSVEPLKDGAGCRTCGYPGPLLTVEDPPICVYCLIRQVRKGGFVKEEVERALKVAPLIAE